MAIDTSGNLSIAAPAFPAGQPAPAGKKYAIRKLVRKDDGMMAVVYVDAATGQQLDNLDGYVVYSIHEAQKAGITLPSNVTDATKDDEKGDETTAENIRNSVTFDEKAEEGTVGTGRGGGGGLGGLFDRSPSNNYGYIDTPGWLSLAGFAPVVGPYAKMADRVIGVNNTIANNEARKTVGLEGLGLARSLGNIFGLRDESTVANVNIGKNPYSIGFEATNKLGQTTLTPEEARKRGLIMDVPVTEMTRKQTKEFEDDFEYTKPGLLQGVRNTIGSFFGGSNKYGLNDFPEAPASPTNYGGGDAHDSPIGGYYGDDGNDGYGGYNTPSGLGGSAPGGGFSVGDIADSLGGGSSDASDGGYDYGGNVGGLW